MAAAHSLDARPGGAFMRAGSGCVAALRVVWRGSEV
jgi:hypothetical protein